MLWIFLAVSGYFLLALVNIFDKFLLGKYVKNPTVYTIYVSFLGLLALLLAPFGFAIPSLDKFFITLVAGLTSFIGLLLFFKALEKEEASRVIPVIGGLTPIYSLILAVIFLGERLTALELIAFVLLLMGTIVISIFKSQKARSAQGLTFAAVAALAIAVSFIFSKSAFINLGFINGFIWIRLSFFLGALWLLRSSVTRQAIVVNLRSLSPKIKAGYLGNQVLGGGGFLLQNYAISLASVPLVNALQGTQYVFVLLLAIVLTLKFPGLIKEKINTSIIVQKVAAVLLIAGGLVLLFMANS